MNPDPSGVRPPANPDRRLRIAVLASGHGSNLQAIIDAIASGWLVAELAGVFCDRPAAQALLRARAAGVPATVVRPRDFASREQHDQHLFNAIDDVQPDLIVCAGYMRLLGPSQVEARAGRVVNIHPSLLPAFKGLHTHQRALDAGVDEHGASVHFVTAELDGGPVVTQARVPVRAGDDAQRLAARVRAREHPLLIETLRLLAARRLRLAPAGVTLDNHALARPLQLGGDGHLLTP